MSRTAILLTGFVIAFHALAYALEALLWMNPAIHVQILGKLNPDIMLGAAEQAVVLRTLFVNQGFYNLFLATVGFIGLVALSRGHRLLGRTLVATLCAIALGAGIVLAATTHAYVGAALQALPAALVLLLMRSGQREL